MTEGTTRRSAVQWAGLAAGPLLAALCYALLPEHYRDTAGELVAFSRAGRVTTAVMAWMATWWLTEAVDIAATALLPVALLPALGAASIGEATAPYADKLIFLFLGGFLLALAIQRWGLDRRFALVTLRVVGDRPGSIVAGMMAVTALLSMFVSNTATAAMMLPIALSVIELLRDRSADDGAGARGGRQTNFALCTMLGIAYAASIGGVGTKIGTPPNGIVLGFVDRTYGRTIDFVTWLRLALPVVLVLLPLTWLLLTRVVYPLPRGRIAGARRVIGDEYRRLGAVKTGEWTVLAVFAATAVAWMTRPIIADGLELSGRRVLPPLVPGLEDAGIAIIAALLLFVIPVEPRRRLFVLDWETAKRVPWGILVLFGGGLSLAAAIKDNGVAEFIATKTTAFGAGAPAVVVVLAVTALVVFLTELTSNTATTATLVPVLAALAPGLGVSPYLLIFPAAIAASCAFMMPVATPPNAIVFGSGFLSIPQMARAGLWLNLIAIGLITLAAFAVIGPQLDAAAGPGP